MSSRGLFLAWLRRHRIDPAAVPRLTFDTPIGRYSEPAFRAWGERIDNVPRQDAHWRDESVRRAIWGMSGDAFTVRRRQSSAVRAEARRCLSLLRRVWAAHAAGRDDLARAEFANARDAWLSHANEIQSTAAFAEFRRHRDAVAYGTKGGRPRKDDQAAAWMRRYDRMATTHRTLTAQERYEQIAADDLGTDAKWRTVRNAISEHRKRQK